MKITLRKANAVQLGINEAVKALKFDTTVNLNEFHNVDQTLAHAMAKFTANEDRRQNLVNALKEIRLAVGTANGQVGIDQRLTEIAHLEKNIQFYTGLAGSDVRESLDVVNGKLDKIRGRKEESRLYGYNDTVATGLFDEARLNEFKAAVKALKKQKQKLQDEVLELNVRTEITLSEPTAQVLIAEGLL